MKEKSGKVQVQGRRELAVPCLLSLITHHPSLCRVGVGGKSNKNQRISHSLSLLKLRLKLKLFPHITSPACGRMLDERKIRESASARQKGISCSLPFVTHHPSPITLQSRSRGKMVISERHTWRCLSVSGINWCQSTPRPNAYTRRL